MIFRSKTQQCIIERDFWIRKSYNVVKKEYTYDTFWDGGGRWRPPCRASTSHLRTSLLLLMSQNFQNQISEDFLK